MSSKRDSLQELFRTLLHQLMTAQLRVDNVDLSDLNSCQDIQNAT
jgi:hypothetical protein